jgi:hypothetical protein
MEMLKRIEADLRDYAIVETHPRLEGRQMTMVLAPGKRSLPPQKETKAAAPKEASGGGA